MERTCGARSELQSNGDICAGCGVRHAEVRDEDKRREEQAMRDNAPSYKDSRSGLNVFTRTYLASRKTCCGYACRHCPYNHQNVRAFAPHDSADSRSSSGSSADQTNSESRQWYWMQKVVKSETPTVPSDVAHEKHETKQKEVVNQPTLTKAGENRQTDLEW